MKLDTRVVIFPCFVSLGPGVELNLSHFLGCYVPCGYMILSISCYTLQMVLSFCKKSLDLTYVSLFLWFECSCCPNMHKCCHNLV